MKASIVFSKKKATDEKGYLFIVYREKRKTPIKVSLNYTLTKDDFKKYWNPAFHGFTPNKKIDFKAINEKISEKILLNPFEPQKKEIKHFQFLEYLATRKELKTNHSTINTYNSAERMMVLFLQSEGYSDIEFSQIDNDMVKRLHNYCAKQGLQNSTIRFYCNVYSAIFNAAFENKVYVDDNPFSKNKPSVTKKQKTVLSDEDVLKLLEITPNQKYFYESRMFLFAMFGNGMRSSDMLLMKFGNIKRDYLEYFQQKTDEAMKVEYSDKVVVVLMDIFGLSGRRLRAEKESKIQIPTENGFNFIPYREARRKMLEKISFNEVDKDYQNYHGYQVKSTDTFSKTVIDELRRVQRNINVECKHIIYQYVSKQNKKELIFNGYMNTTVFADYDNKLALPMNEEQFKTYKSRYTGYNAKLKRLAQLYSLSVDNMTTHVARYTLTNVMLDMGMNTNDVRVVLGHASLNTTSQYVEKGFSFKKSSQMSDGFNTRYISRK